MDQETELRELRAALTAALRERDLYRKLLDLDGASDVEDFLRQALSLMVELASARRGYIELRGGDDDDAPFWMDNLGLYDAEVDEIREALSSGIIAEAIATGRTIAPASALSDPRFASLRSVLRNGIEAVVCAPIGADPAIGVIYLQDRIASGPFSDEDCARVETFARHVGTIADRLLLLRKSAAETDPTRALRARLRVEGILGESEAIAGVLGQIALTAPLDVSVLLTGDSGTGKTQVARAIHDNGPRRGGNFVEINCAAIPETLLERELFGNVQGAYTGADKRAEGKIAAANGGTLFLDEVGELHPSIQPKLLQFLHSREYYPVGASRPVRADVRLIAATNVDLEAAVANKGFRKDLYYRLQVLSIRLPALAERRGDIPILVRHFCEQAVKAHGLPRLTVSPSALRGAQIAEWPGNVRQLAHAVESAAIRAAGERSQAIEARHLFPPSPKGQGPSAVPLSFQEATRQCQKAHVKSVLDFTGWNITEAARILDIARSYLHKLITDFGFERGR